MRKSNKTNIIININININNINNNNNNNSASPRRAEENERTQQLEQHQNVLTSPPRRITLQPSPLKASNQRPEASPGMRALGLSPSPVKQIHNGNNDKNRKQQQTDEDETMKETLEYRGGYLDAHPKLEKATVTSERILSENRLSRLG